MIKLISPLFLSLSLFLLCGCGGHGKFDQAAPLQAGTTYTDSQGQSFTAGGTVPAPGGLTIPPVLPHMDVLFINQSSQITSLQFAQFQYAINWQLTNDFNSRWSCDGILILYSNPTGNIDPVYPTIVLQDASDDTLPGAVRISANGAVPIWRVLVLPHTFTSPEHLQGYLSHATINLVRYDYLPGQAVEPFNYAFNVTTQKADYTGSQGLADFDFPEHHGFKVKTLDYKGDPAFDMLGILKYP